MERTSLLQLAEETMPPIRCANASIQSLESILMDYAVAAKTSAIALSGDSTFYINCGTIPSAKSTKPDANRLSSEPQ